MAAHLRLVSHVQCASRQLSLHFLPVASFPLHHRPPPPHYGAPPRRTFTQKTYDHFFSPSPPDPTVWNRTISSAEWYFSALHDFSGVSWGWSVVLGTFLLRSAVTLPLLVLSEINQDRLHRLYSEVASTGVKERLMKQIDEIAVFRPDALSTTGQKEALLNRERKAIMRKEYQKRNCHPGKTFGLPLVQIPIWFASSVALRNMSGSYVVDGARISPTCPGMAGEAFSWVPDLCLPDGTGVISVLLFLTYLTLIEINVYKQFNGEPMRLKGRIITNLLRALTLVVPIFALFVPTTVSLYWLTSAVVGLVHNVVVMSPRLRRGVGITLRASPHDTPARTIWNGFKGYWKL